MSTLGYIGINNISKKIKSLYIGINNLSKKVNKAYIGVNGFSKLWYTSKPDPIYLFKEGVGLNTTLFGFEKAAKTTVTTNSITFSYDSDRKHWGYYAVGNKGSYPGAIAKINFNKKFPDYHTLCIDCKSSSLSYRATFGIMDDLTETFISGQKNGTTRSVLSFDIDNKTGYAGGVLQVSRTGYYGYIYNMWLE